MGDKVNTGINRTLLLTGATSGLGYEIVKNSMELFGKYILIGRDFARLQNVKNELLEIRPSLDITFYAVDFSDESAVYQVAQKIIGLNPIIDVCIHNAGALFSNYEKSRWNLEKTMVVNYLSHFILLETLKGVLGPDTQIINIVSSTYKNGKKKSLYNYGESYSIRQAYADSKLALMMYSQYLQDNFAYSIHCFHPGRLKTEIGAKHTMIFHKIYWRLSKFFAESPEKYAKFLLEVIQMNFEKKESGFYWNVYDKIPLSEIQILKGCETLMRDSRKILDQIKKLF